MQHLQSETCPICDSDVGNVKNHIRMSSDDAHGPQGTYPDGFPSSTTSEPADDLPEESTLTIDLEDDADQEDGADQEGDVDEDLATLELGDTSEDASDYECAECGDRLEYHQEECKCGEAPMWRVVQ